MAKAKYDVGDILTWSKDGDYYATAIIVKYAIYRDYVDGTTDIQYDIFYKNDHYDTFELIRSMPDYALRNYKLVGHIDISGMSIKEIETELVYAIATAWNGHRIAYAVQAHWALMKLREPKEESEYVKMGFCIPKKDNPFYYDNLADKLAEECKQKQKHLDLANNKIFELKKEVDSLRQSLRNDSTRIHKNLSKMGFTEDAIYSIMYSEPNDI